MGMTLSFKNWLELYADADNSVRGRKFEELTKRYLLRNEPNVEKVWLWEEWPDRPGADMGIDLVVKTRDAELWAVQCKNYTHTVGWGDIATFVNDSSEGFTRRILFTTLEEVSSNLRKQLDRRDMEHYGPAHFADFDCSEDDAVVPPRIKLYPYQREAVAAVAKELRAGKHCTMVMPTGAGKTVVFSRIAGKKKFMFAVPSIFLASQSARAFLADDPSRRAIIVCSDKTTGRSDEKWAGVPVCKTVDDIREYPNHSVFVTYDSLWKVLEAGRTFDVIFGDEAHRLANSGTKGKEIWDFGTPIVWGTATPKTLSSALKGKGVDVSSMDDETLFGREVVNVSVRSLIEQGYLSNYHVVVMAVGDSETAKFIAQRGYVQAGKQLMNAEDAAFYIAMEKMRDEYDVNRIVTYHSTISQTREAAKTLRDLKFRSEHIEAKTPDYDRRRILRKLETGGIVPNAHTLSEGVDIPTLDAVCFATPKRSKIDIVQSVGRALRLDPANPDKLGYVVLPVVVEPGGDIKDRLEQSNFRDVFRVLNYLAEVDDAVRAEIEEIRTGDGAAPRTVDSKPARIIIIDSRVAGMSKEDMAREIKMHIVHNGVREDWWDRARRCVADYEKLGKPKTLYTGDSEFAQLHGTWLQNQLSWYKKFRATRRTTPFAQDRADFLTNSISNWVKDPNPEQEVIDYCAAHGHQPKDATRLYNLLSGGREKRRAWALEITRKYPTAQSFETMKKIDDLAEYIQKNGRNPSKGHPLQYVVYTARETTNPFVRDYVRRNYPWLIDREKARERWGSSIRQSTLPKTAANIREYVDIANHIRRSPSKHDSKTAPSRRCRWRKAYREGTLAQEHIDMLEACEYWTWE